MLHAGTLLSTSIKLPTVKLAGQRVKAKFLQLGFADKVIYKLFKKKKYDGNKYTHQAAKSNVNRLVTIFEPFYKGLRRLIVRCKIKKAKPYYINFWSPICIPKEKQIGSFNTAHEVIFSTRHTFIYNS